MGERTVADTHNDSFRMPLREPRSEPVSNLTAGRRTVIQSFSHRLPHCGPRLWPGWQPVGLHVYASQRFGVNVRFCRD